jgi:hypothetical protein
VASSSSRRCCRVNEGSDRGGNKVVTRLHMRGRHKGELSGIPPSGNDMDVTAVAIQRIADGKVVEHWGTADPAALMAQLGLITLPEPPAS